MKTASSKPAAPFAYEGLDRVIHERARLSVLTSLVTHSGGLSFVKLKQLCALTDGNLARHLQVLQKDGMIRLNKAEEAGRPERKHDPFPRTLSPLKNKQFKLRRRQRDNASLRTLHCKVTPQGLAAAMYITRNTDWYGLATPTPNLATAAASPSPCAPETRESWLE